MHLDVLEPEGVVSGAVVGDSIQSSEPEVSRSEGDTVTLSCSYDTSYTGAVYLYWYRQYPNRAPQYILLRGAKGSTFSDTAHFAQERFSSQSDDSSTVLNISALELADTAVYLCALRLAQGDKQKLEQTRGYEPRREERKVEQSQREAIRIERNRREHTGMDQNKSDVNRIKGREEKRGHHSNAICSVVQVRYCQTGSMHTDILTYSHTQDTLAHGVSLSLSHTHTHLHRQTHCLT
uniref:Ig-like domain-containing protein n=1 Tax=Gopherus evgoodei TaxID=1825980 RepID=A0A8C4Y7P9_9SAUR